MGIGTPGQLCWWMPHVKHTMLSLPSDDPLKSTVDIPGAIRRAQCSVITPSLLPQCCIISQSVVVWQPGLWWTHEDHANSTFIWRLILLAGDTARCGVSPKKLLDTHPSFLSTCNGRGCLTVPWLWHFCEPVYTCALGTWPGSREHG